MPRRRPRVKPPFGGLRVNWGHPLARGLVGLYLFNEGGGEPINLVNRRRAGGTGTWSAAPHGRSLENYAGTSAGSPEMNFTTGEWSVAALADLRNRTGSEDPKLFARIAYVDESDNQGWQLSNDINGKWRFGVYNNNGFGSYNLHSVSDSADGPNLLVGTTDGTTRRIYVNGVDEANTTNNPSAASAVAGLSTNSTATERLRAYVGYGWSRALTAAEVLELYRDPWSMIEPERRRRWAFVAATGTTLAAGTNTITFSAPAATLVTSGTATLAAGVAAITFSAPAATLVQPGLLLAGVNEITFSAPAAALLASGTVTLPAGTNTITFEAPLATIPGTGEFAAWLSEIATSRIILCELQPAEQLTGWTVVGGQPNTYSRAWASIIQAGVVPGGVYRRLDSVRLNDVELVQRASIALVNANLGSYFYDEAAGTLYVSTSTGSDPDTFAAIAAYFSLFLATEPADFVGGQLYEPRLTGDLPTVQAAADDPFVAIKTLVDGLIHAVNTHAFFDVLADAYVWRNKTARLFLGGGDLPRDSYAQIAVCEIDYLAVSDASARLGIRSLASWLEQTLPLHVFTKEEYPRLAEGLEGTYKPILYGAKANTPGLCVDMYVMGTPDFAPGVASYQDVYLVADASVQVLTGVTAVRAVNRTTGELRGLSTTQYTVNLAACTVTVTTDTFRADEWDIRIDATGESDGAGGYLSTFGEIARDVLLALGESAANIDTASFIEADERAPFPLGLWIREPAQATGVMALLQQSVIGGVFTGNDGRWRAYVLDASDDPDPVAALDDADFSAWKPVERIDPVYPVVRCFYNEDPVSGEARLTTAQQDAARYLFETSDGLTVRTALLESSDAQILAQRYRLLATSPDHQFDVRMRGLSLMTANLYDRVLVSRNRAPGGSYVSKRMELLGFTKTLGPPGVQLRLGDIAGISDIVGRIRAVAPDGIPDYGLASAAERELYAFVADDSGLVDPGDPSTQDHSVIW